MRVLVCEDEKNLNRLICKKLEKENYNADGCFDGEEGWYYLEHETYDLVILDVMMPKLNGYDLLKKMREKGMDVSVLFLTARDSSEDIVLGLDLGANDYVVKPFSFEELMARVRMLIRTRPKRNTCLFKVLDLEVNTTMKTVKRSGDEINLTKKEYSILEYMLYNKNIVLTKEQIEEHIWNYDYEGDTNLVKVYMSYLRKKVDGPYEVKLIQTVRGVGYMLKGEDDET